MPAPGSRLISNRAAVYILAFFYLIAIARSGVADSSLLYKEAQFVVGFKPDISQLTFYSQSQLDVMQKPSLGIDYLHRFSDETGDKARFAFQGRLAWNNLGTDRKFEPQIYNAYIKFKNPTADLWLGHARVAYGLSSYFDSHALLLPTLGMSDLGFDRDWGAGLAHDTAWGDLSFSLTTGSGMPLYAGENNLVSGRISWGVLNRDNVNVGLSKASGKLLQPMEYDFMPGMIYAVDYTGIDAAFLFENYELRAESTAGSKDAKSYHSFWVRGGIKMLEEEILKLELQATSATLQDLTQRLYSAGIAYLLNEDITLRMMYQTGDPSESAMAVFQCYYYTPW